MQFFRGFPGPKDVSDEEMMSLVQRYKSLTNPGFVDYLAFEKDLKTIDSYEKALEDNTKLVVSLGKYIKPIIIIFYVTCQ